MYTLGWREGVSPIVSCTKWLTHGYSGVTLLEKELFVLVEVVDLAVLAPVLAHCSALRGSIPGCRLYATCLLHASFSYWPGSWPSSPAGTHARFHRRWHVCPAPVVVFRQGLQRVVIHVVVPFAVLKVSRVRPSVPEHYFVPNPTLCWSSTLVVPELCR